MFSRATKRLVEGLSGVSAAVNPTPPRKGTFVVTYNGEELISLIGMPRPFKALREIDWDVEIERIQKKLK